MSNFRLPITSTSLAPSMRRRSASASLCANTRLKPPKTGLAASPKRAARRNERADIRALVNTSGTPRSRHVKIRFGQTSVSITTPTLGRQCFRNRRIDPTMSYGR